MENIDILDLEFSLISEQETAPIASELYEWKFFFDRKLLHIFYSDGDAKKISWAIQTNDSVSKEFREHIGTYKDKVTNLQSKYIALHVGLFWAIGVFIIKNEDAIKIKLDKKIMYDHLESNLKSCDDLIQKRIQFIQQLIKQRNLKIEFQIIEEKQNLAKID
ncbi:MAG: hypothetical protein ACR2LL_07460 [Nitrosopumilus sp.]